MTMPKPFVPSKLENAGDQQTTSGALGIDLNRKKKLEWYVEEAFAVSGKKADAIKKIATADATDEEKIYMGYLLTQYIIYKTTPKYLYDLICKLCRL